MNKIYLPGLNALRGIAAFSVMITHILLHLNKSSFLSIASHSVTMFFVLSGFLITYLLILEKEKTNTISIKSFYVRRVLRIWPLYYFYLFIALFLIFYFKNYHLEKNYSIIFSYIFFSAHIPKFVELSIPFISHYWSLSVEEHFYLWWPWIMKKSKSPIYIIIILTILLFLLKFIFHLISPWGLGERIIHFSRFHTMMIGAIGAYIYKYQYRSIDIITKKGTQIIAWSIVILVGAGKLYSFGIGFIRTEIFALAIIVIILSQVSEKGIPFFENKVSNFFGKISYGMYVLHMLVILIFSIIKPELEWNPYLFTFGVILCTIIFSYLSYEYLEKYFIGLKEKFTIIKSSNSPN